jgi:nucleoside-diphosphate-sugar epimerase
MKTILITGINGFLGSYLAKELSKDYIVIGLEYSLNDLFRIKHLPFKIYSSENDLEIVFKENSIYAIIHAATVYRRNNEPIENLLNTNILLPVILYNLADQYNVDLFVNTDSFFNDPKYNYSYLQDYTLSKKQAVEWLKLCQHLTKLINMKIFHMYGPNDSSNKFIPQIISRLKNDEPTIDLTAGEQTRDFIFIDDVIDAFKVVIRAHHSQNDGFVEFQVGTGYSVTLKEFISTAKEIIKSNTELLFGTLPYRANEIMESKSDNSALLELGWVPKYSLEKGIQKMI